MTKKAPDWALPKLLCLPDDEFVGPNFSSLALVALHELYTEFPNQVDLSGHESLVKHAREFRRLWEWLRGHGVVVGPLSNCALTLSGKDSLVAALDFQPQFADELMRKKAELDERYSSALLMTVLRHHFDKFHK